MVWRNQESPLSSFRDLASLNLTNCPESFKWVWCEDDEYTVWIYNDQGSPVDEYICLVFFSFSGVYTQRFWNIPRVSEIMLSEPLSGTTDRWLHIFQSKQTHTFLRSFLNLCSHNHQGRLCSYVLSLKFSHIVRHTHTLSFIPSFINSQYHICHKIYIYILSFHYSLIYATQQIPLLYFPHTRKKSTLVAHPDT